MVHNGEAKIGRVTIDAKITNAEIGSTFSEDVSLPTRS
jgi:hypothetical protein